MVVLLLVSRTSQQCLPSPTSVLESVSTPSQKHELAQMTQDQVSPNSVGLSTNKWDAKIRQNQERAVKPGKEKTLQNLSCSQIEPLLYPLSPSLHDSAEEGKWKEKGREGVTQAMVPGGLSCLLCLQAAVMKAHVSVWGHSTLLQTGRCCKYSSEDAVSPLLLWRLKVQLPLPHLPRALTAGKLSSLLETLCCCHWLGLS